MVTQSLEIEKMTKNNVLQDHNIQAALNFLENLYQEILICSDIDELKDPIILKKFSEIIEYLNKILLDEKS